MSYKHRFIDDNSYLVYTTEPDISYTPPESEETSDEESDDEGNDG